MTAATRGSLRTLAFPVSDDLLGMVYITPLGKEFAEAWRALPTRAPQDHQKPTASLTTAARAVTGQRMVFIGPTEPDSRGPWPGQALIITPQPVMSDTLTMLFREWQTRLPIGAGDTLSSLLELGDSGAYLLAELIDRDASGRITGPGWIREVAGWNIAARLAAQPLIVPGRATPIRFVLDSDGNLLSWNDQISRTAAWEDAETGERRSVTGHAMHKISVEVGTLPGASEFVAFLDANITRTAASWSGVKNLYVAPPAAGAVILKTPVKIKWPHRTSPDIPAASSPESVSYLGATAQIVEAFGLAPLPELAGLNFDTDLGPVRPIHNADRHPIGTGVGARFLLHLADHAANVLGAAPITYQATRMTTPRPDFPAVMSPDKILRALTAAGWQSLRLVVLYNDPEFRSRVLWQAARSFQRPDLQTIADGPSHMLADGVSIICCRAPELVVHGTHDRTPIANALPCLRPDPGMLIAVLAETQGPVTGSDDGQQQDAKHLLRELLGARGIPLQALMGGDNGGAPERTLTIPERTARKRARDAGEPEPPLEDRDDYAAQAALADLLRGAGLTDNRLAHAVAPKSNAQAHLSRDAVLVGVKIRLHTFPRRRGKPARPALLSVCLVALHASPSPDSFWRAEMYGPDGWKPYSTAAARRMAAPIGLKGLSRFGDKAHTTRSYIDGALSELKHQGHVVVFVEGENASLWSGLRNNSFGEGPLPGDSLHTAGIDIAVIRVSSDKIPRPTERREAATVDDPDRKPLFPGSTIYTRTQDGITSWIYAQATVSHRGGNRTGTDHTRFTLPDSQLTKLKDNWHSIARVEYTIPRLGTWDAEHLIALAARLSNQTASWGDRTVLPLPLHMAQQADQDHPQFQDRDNR
ncbi:RNaseH domain-containing protein [Herbidospora cretacea]|uniref:RNaseH domain-containing protein n=1 Tax=Herbidospora cretacea TaxID=28444 RepID=UPI0007743625|nr:RNaseH domain-containing protein [Herbidospora cretacea]